MIGRDLSSATASVGIARRMVSELAQRWTRDSDTVFDIELACSELATNAVEYGVGDTFHVFCKRAGDRFELEISSVAAAGTTVPVIGSVVPPPNSLTGRGLWIARSISDRMEVSLAESTLRVRCEFTRRDPI